MSTDVAAMHPIFLREFPIEQVGYLGAAVLDQSTATAMAKAIFRAVDEMPTGAVRDLIVAEHNSHEILSLMYENRPPEPPAGQTPGSYEIGTLGVCMEPVINNGEAIELDPAAPVRPDGMVALVTSGSLYIRGAMYLGRHTGEPILSTFGESRPASAYVFLQKTPIMVLAAADVDLLAMHRVVAVTGCDGRRLVPAWPLDVRAHPSLGAFWQETATDPVCPGTDMTVTMAQHLAVRSTWDRLGALIEEAA